MFISLNARLKPHLQAAQSYTGLFEKVLLAYTALMYPKDANPLFLNLIEKILLLYNQQHGIHIFSYISKAEAIGWVHLWFLATLAVKRLEVNYHRFNSRGGFDFPKKRPNKR